MTWWRVKVYDPESGTTTTLDKWAESVEAIREDLEADALWIFVSATPDNNEGE